LGPNTDAFLPKPYMSDETSKNRQIQSRYVLNAAYLRLRNIRIGYSVPKSFLNKLHVQSASIYLSGSNLLTITSLPKVMDPETFTVSDENGRAGLIYPISRTVSVGVNVKF